jgi:hypothetical protein
MKVHIIIENIQQFRKVFCKMLCSSSYPLTEFISFQQYEVGSESADEEDEEDDMINIAK